jgi:hypothetical protein
VQPSTKIVRHFTPRRPGDAGVLPLEMTCEDVVFRGRPPVSFTFAIAGRLVRLQGLDLTCERAPGVDLLRGQDIALVGLLAEHGGRAGEEGHVTS